MRAYETTMIRLAVEVERAARVAKEGPQLSADVRLALRVLALYMRRDVLERFWEQVGDDAGVPWSHALMMHGWIVQALTEEGWEVTPGSLPCEGWAMCNRYRMSAAQAELIARYGIEPPSPEDLTVPAPELFPDRLAWAVTNISGWRELHPMKWGWPRTLPGKRPDTTVKTQVTNVRNLESPFWRSALSTPKQRCLVPVTAFSEYGARPVGKKPLWWLGRNGGRDGYRATRSDLAAWNRALRPKPCKLACHRALRRTVSARLSRNWSPAQIAGWLGRGFPDEEHRRVSHETIYKSLYIQARGVLKKELLEHLRAGARSGARATPA